jgi:hypothetical protein
MTRFPAVALAAALFGNALRADPIPVVNPSFEQPGANPGQFVGGISSGPPGWDVYNTIPANTFRYFGVVNPAGSQLYVDPVPHGQTIGVVFLLNTTGIAEAGLQQTLTTTLQTNSQYSLRVDVGNMAFDPNPPFNEFNFTGFPGYRVDLLAGNAVIASDNNTLLPGEGRFLTSTVTFQTGATHALAGQNLGIRLVNLNGPGIEVNFDNVRFDVTPVPEPGAILLAISIMFGFRRSSRDYASAAFHFFTRTGSMAESRLPTQTAPRTAR